MRTRLDPELYDDDLAWLAQSYDADMGCCGTLSATVAALEHGGHVSSGEAVVWSMIERLHRSMPAVARARRVMPRWRRLDPESQRIAMIHYGSEGQLPARSDALLGEFAKVALATASADPATLRRLLRALERGDSGVCAPKRLAAERLVRAAHKAWIKTATKEADEWAS